MTERPLKNVAASVRQRLMNSAKASGRPFQEVLQYFAMERFLYRLSQSPHAERFILKGALLFNLWGAPSSRPTRDIDLLGLLNNRVDTLVPVFRDVCQLAVELDGLVYAVANDPIKQTQWKGFVRKSRLAIAPADFPMVVAALGNFLRPLAVAITTGQQFALTWHPSGLWQ